MKMNKNDILKIYGTEYKEMTKQLLEASELEKLIPEKQSKIGIKPNLVAPIPAEYGGTTHPEVVAGIIEYLQEHGYNNLVIMEGSWVGDKTQESFEVCGYLNLAEHYHIELIDMQKEKGMERDCAGLLLNVCECIQSIDFLINVPVLKGHCQTKITCALKNMKGLIPNSEKRRFHAMGLHDPIGHLSAGIHQDFIVIDHICGDLDFEDGGNPVIRNCVMTALDPVLTDAYVCNLLHYDVTEVPYIVNAAKLGVGCMDLSQANIVTIGDQYNEEDLPRKRKVVELQDAVEEVESCSACYGCLIPALDQLKEEGILTGLKEKICIGQGFQGKTGKLGVGKCTSKFDMCIMGCPPSEEKIYQELKSYLLGMRSGTSE